MWEINTAGYKLTLSSRIGYAGAKCGNTLPLYRTEDSPGRHLVTDNAATVW